MNYLPQTFEGKFLFSNWTIKDKIQSYIFCKQSKKIKKIILIKRLLFLSWKTNSINETILDDCKYEVSCRAMNEMKLS